MNRLVVEARRMMEVPESGPLVNLTAGAARAGLLAFARDLGPDVPDAATTLLRSGGVSVINSERAVGRRRLALAHEFGHFLAADPYTVDRSVGAAGQDAVERAVDGFARALLLPETSLRDHWLELDGRPLREASVITGSRFQVDMSTLATRLAGPLVVDTGPPWSQRP